VKNAVCLDKKGYIKDMFENNYIQSYTLHQDINDKYIFSG